MQTVSMAANPCSACLAPLMEEDGHDQCPHCLGVEHLKQGLTEEQCMNCSYMSRDLKLARLLEVEQQKTDSQMPPSGVVAHKSKCKRKASPPKKVLPSKKPKKTDQLAVKVDSLTAQFAEMRELLLNLQPDRPVPRADGPQTVASDQEWDDVLSTRASCTDFGEEPSSELTEDASRESVTGSERSCSEARVDSGPTSASIKPVIKMALARLGLDQAPATAVAPMNAFFRRAPPQAAFSVPPSEQYIKELHKCWGDPRSQTHRVSDARALASMQDADNHGLGSMPSVEPSIASLICTPDEALRPVSRCPRPQCRLTDDLLVKSYDAAARVGRIGNSLSHILLALSQSLQTSGVAASSSAAGAEGAEGAEGESAVAVDASVQSLSDASLEALAYMTTEVGRLLSTLTLTRRQVWLAQSPLSEPCRNILRALPVVPGQLFTSAAQQALERSLQARQTRQQYASLQSNPAVGRQRPAPGYDNGRFRSRQGGYPRANFRAPAPHPAASHQAPLQRGRGPGFRPPRYPRGQRGRP